VIDSVVGDGNGAQRDEDLVGHVGCICGRRDCLRVARRGGGDDGLELLQADVCRRCIRQQLHRYLAVDLSQGFDVVRRELIKDLAKERGMQEGVGVDANVNAS
tara:strand:+ start:216 stop:524 length:309 start_codon:yes stop_codon:yes gene_type:complete